MAEVIRGGLQAIPRGQYEAGASHWASATGQRMGFIILPQALKHVIPGIVGIFISLFKDTSLVSIVGIFDLLNAIQAGTSRRQVVSHPRKAFTGYIFAAMHLLGALFLHVALLRCTWSAGSTPATRGKLCPPNSPPSTGISTART